jgi:hypothetical protein
MTTIALFGAGGKMGYRLSTNFRNSPYEVRHVEVSESGRERLKAGLGFGTVSPDEALDGADAVILAVPDTHIGKVAASIDSRLASGTMLIVLDAAAPFAGHLPKRPDLTYFITHPCHPPIFNDETEMEAKKDYFGGAKAKQHFVSALMQGPEEDFAKGEAIARVIWAPVMRSHRVTVEQLALLEPGLRFAARRHEGGGRRSRRARRRPAGGSRLPARPHERAGRGHIRPDQRRVLRRLQQGDRVRQARADARRLEARVRAAGNRRQHPADHLMSRGEPS